MSESHTSVDLPPRPRGGRRSGDDRRVRGPGSWMMIGIALALVVGVVVISSISQTRWGREQVLRLTLETLGGRLNGRLNVGRLEGNLIAGARLYEVSLVGPDSVPLARLDSAFIRYELATFLGGDVVITRLDVFDGEVNVFRLPGDTLWNYQVILQDPTPGPAGDPRATLIERLFATNIDVEITTPVEGDPRLSEAQRQVALEEMLADTARYMIEETPLGYVQHNLIDVEQGEVAELYIGGEERGGLYLEVVDGRADVRLWRDPPLEIEGVTAQLHLAAEILNFDAPRLVLPNSEGSAVGRVDMSGERPLYDVVIEAPEFALADLRFLYPWLPDEPGGGRGAVHLRVQDRPDGLLVAARDLRLAMPDTRIVGNFGMITDIVSEQIRFVDVELEAEPLRVESVEALLPEDLPVEGLVIGGATIRGES